MILFHLEAICVFRNLQSCVRCDTKNTPPIARLVAVYFCFALARALLPPLLLLSLSLPFPRLLASLLGSRFLLMALLLLFPQALRSVSHQHQSNGKRCRQCCCLQDQIAVS